MLWKLDFIKRLNGEKGLLLVRAFKRCHSVQKLINHDTKGPVITGIHDILVKYCLWDKISIHSIKVNEMLTDKKEKNAPRPPAGRP